MNHLAQFGVASLVHVSGFDDMLDQPPKDFSGTLLSEQRCNCGD